MKIEFDPSVDALYINLSKGEIEKTKEVQKGIMMDFDKDGNVLGIEVLDVSKREELPIQQAA